MGTGRLEGDRATRLSPFRKFRRVGSSVVPARTRSETSEAAARVVGVPGYWKRIVRAAPFWARCS